MCANVYGACVLSQGFDALAIGFIFLIWLDAILALLQKPETEHNQKLLQFFALYEKSKNNATLSAIHRRTQRARFNNVLVNGIALAAIIIICRSVSTTATSAIKAFSFLLYLFLRSWLASYFCFILIERFAIDYMLFYVPLILLHYSIISLRLMFN